LPFTVLIMFVPNPDPILVVAVTVVMRSAKTLGAIANKSKTADKATPWLLKPFFSLV